MNISQIEESLAKIIENFSKDSFIYDLLSAYDLPKASISRLKNGNLNLSKVSGEISWKKKVFFKEIDKQDPHITITEMADNLKYNQRFVIVTDYKTLLAIDTKTKDTLDIVIKDIAKHSAFFLPWAGIEKANIIDENPADRKAAEKMAKLFDEIRKDNPDKSQASVHALNVFLTRLLFCLFAEDTGIFEKNQFTNSISSHTQSDGSDLDKYLEKLFEVMNTPEGKRGNLSQYFSAFPYVNGGLFKDKIVIPKLSRKSRQAIIDSGGLDWSEINPDIFGSMFQAVIAEDKRGNLGMHYTSVPNIMKVIKPLFLDELYEELENSRGSQKKLRSLLDRVQNIKIFDPACGSGNFLIIAYKELRKLEIEIFKAGDIAPSSQIYLSHFYGIEIDDFACEIAHLSLWLAEHQMNTVFKEIFGFTAPALPLKDSGKIICANACRIAWEDICPLSSDKEVYVLGNPPYLGGKLQDANQKDDLELVAGKNCKNLDYISCWFIKGSNYIKGKNAHLAFVTTNSVCQGEQPPLLWKKIFKSGLSVSFAYDSFKWTNNAKHNAGVIVSIVGLSNDNDKKKILYRDNQKFYVSNINAYLLPMQDIFINKHMKPISEFPDVLFGSMPRDGGFLNLTLGEVDELISEYPQASKFIKKYIGSSEFIRGDQRFCIWVEDSELKEALSIPPIYDRIKNVESFRKKSDASSTRAYASKAHRFVQISYQPTPSIIIPRVSSIRREYIPLGFLDTDTVISDLAFAVYSAEAYLFGVLSSKQHMVWVKTFSGKMKTDFRYSAGFCYNTFPFPQINQKNKSDIEQCVLNILSVREKYSEKTLSFLYDPDKMPNELREAHRQNDLAVDRCYRIKPFESDEERLEHLFKLYEKMTKEEKSKSKGK